MIMLSVAAWIVRLSIPSFVFAIKLNSNILKRGKRLGFGGHSHNRSIEASLLVHSHFLTNDLEQISPLMSMLYSV